MMVGSQKTITDRPKFPAISIARLMIDLSSDDKEKRRVAAERLGRLRESRAIAPLIEASGRGGGERAKRATIRALARIGKPAIRSLINTMFSSGESIFRRASAAEALGPIGSRRAVKPLLRAMNDSSVDVRLHALVSLSRLKEKSAIPYLVRALSDESGGVRVNATVALGIFRSRRVVVPLVKALEDEKWYVRQQAARSLGLIGDRRAVKGLQSAVRDERPAVARAAREALRMLAGKGAP